MSRCVLVHGGQSGHRDARLSGVSNPRATVLLVLVSVSLSPGAGPSALSAQRLISRIMAGDLISKRTRQAFREYFVGTTLRIIGDAFDAEEISCDTSYDPPHGGARRCLVEQYYCSVNWKDPSQVAKVLRVYASVLIDLEQTGTDGARRAREQLVNHLQRDGIRFENRRLEFPSSTIQTGYASAVAARLNLPGLQLQIDRIVQSIDTDPAHAIGTAKEMIETTCKSILAVRGEIYSGRADLPELVKQTRKALKLLPEDVPDSARGADAVRQLLSHLGSIAQNVGELRSLYGTGHGKDGKARGLQPRHARLVVGAAAAVATFLLETHEYRPSTASTPTSHVAKDT
jgi:abortive infection Abi-like protein